MQRIALLLTLIGIIFLASFIQISSPLTVNSNKTLEKLLQNQKVQVQGIVVKETQTTFNRILVLDNHITLYCDCANIPKLLNRDIAALGIIDTYQNSKIEVINIKWH
ncbi:MAG: hypothetical protein WCK29_02700 [archaeon]